MAYIPKEWKDLPDETTPIQASDLNHIEQGIGDLSTKVDTLNTNVGDLSTLNTTEKSNLVGSINEVYQNNVYSSDEKIIGKWIDGKPIYKITKIFYLTATGSTSYDISEYKIDTLVDFNSLFIRSGSTVSTDIEKPFYSNSSDYARLFVRGNTSIEVRYGVLSNYTVTQVRCTFLYTKTTD